MSLARARKLGIAEDKLVHIWGGAKAIEPEDDLHLVIATTGSFDRASGCAGESWSRSRAATPIGSNTSNSTAASRLYQRRWPRRQFGTRRNIRRQRR